MGFIVKSFSNSIYIFEKQKKLHGYCRNSPRHRGELLQFMFRVIYKVKVQTLSMYRMTLQFETIYLSQSVFRISTLDFFPLICYRYFTVLSRWKLFTTKQTPEQLPQLQNRIDCRLGLVFQDHCCRNHQSRFEMTQRAQSESPQL